MKFCPFLAYYYYLLIPLAHFCCRIRQSRSAEAAVGECQSHGGLGDCNPENCGELGPACEARYVRFMDPIDGVDRTLRSCRCLRRPVCPLANTARRCQSYSELGENVQRIVRKWTSSRTERQTKPMATARRRMTAITNGTRIGGKNADIQRHFALLKGHSQFCCRIAPRRRRQPSIIIRSGDEGEERFQNSKWQNSVIFAISIVVPLLPIIFPAHL